MPLVADHMTRTLLTVSAQATLGEASSQMAARGVGAVVVLEGEAIAAILTERDVLNAVASGAEAETVTVQDIMTADVVTVGPDWDLVEAAAEMARRRIRHLVVYEGGQLLGVLSVRDVLPALLPR